MKPAFWKTPAFTAAMIFTLIMALAGCRAGAEQLGDGTGEDRLEPARIMAGGDK